MKEEAMQLAKKENRIGEQTDKSDQMQTYSI